MCMSSVEPMTMISDGTITVRMFKGMSTIPIKPAVHNTLDPAELQSAFRDIAVKMSQISLMQ